MITPDPQRPSRLADTLIAVVLAAAFGAPILVGVGGLVGWALHPMLGVLAAACTVVGMSILLYRHLRRKRHGLLVLFEVLVLAVLPCWGLAYSHFMGQAECSVSSCQVGETAFRPLAEPEVLGLLALHVVTVIA